MKRLVVFLCALSILGAWACDSGKNRMEEEMKKTAEIKKAQDLAVAEKKKLEGKEDTLAEEKKSVPPVIDAACGANPEKVKELVNSGTAVDTKDDKGKTPLFCATMKGNKELAEFLISKGADAGAKKADGESILFAALKSGNSDIVNMVSEKNDWKALDNFNRNALMAASFSGNVELMKSAIEKGSDINQLDKYNKNALTFALQEKKVDAAKFLLEKGILVDNIDNMKRTPLFYAIETGDVKLVETLISKKVPVIVEDIIKYKEMVADRKTGQENEVEKERKEKKTAYDIDKKNLLMYAAEGGYTEILKLLVKKGAKLEETEAKILRNPLFFVVALPKGDVEKEKRLAEAAAYLIEEGKKEITVERPSPFKKDKENKPLVEKFKIKKIDLEGYDYEGWTPLTLAAMNGHSEVVKVMLEKGAMVNRKEKKMGNTALIYSRTGKFSEIEQMLKDAGAKEGVKFDADEDKIKEEAAKAAEPKK